MRPDEQASGKYTADSSSSQEIEICRQTPSSKPFVLRTRHQAMSLEYHGAERHIGGRRQVEKWAWARPAHAKSLPFPAITSHPTPSVTTGGQKRCTNSLAVEAVRDEDHPIKIGYLRKRDERGMIPSQLREYPAQTARQRSINSFPFYASVIRPHWEMPARRHDISKSLTPASISCRIVSRPPS